MRGARGPALLALGLGIGAGLASAACGATGRSATASPAATAAAAAGASAANASSSTSSASIAGSAPSDGRQGSAGGGITSTGITAMVTARVAPAGNTLDVTATVTGPAELFGGCQPTLTVTLVDSHGAAAAPSSLPPTVRCLAIIDIGIATGQTQDFTTSVPLPAVHGTYVVRARLNGGGDLPALMITT